MSPQPALLFAFLLSGASGLVYEVLWARSLSVLVGGTAHATQAVLATFFAGLAAGAFWLGPRAARAADGRRFYVRLELGIAAAGVLSGIVIEVITPLAARLCDGTESPRTAALALLMAFLACFPATFLMGATFAAVARAVGAVAQPQALLGRAYASNTAGAVLGSLAGAFVLLPTLGTMGTLGAAVLGNLIAAGLVARTPIESVVADRAAPVTAVPPLPRAFAAALLLSGLAAISLEIVALRILAVTLSDSVYTFAVVIGAYILGASVTAALVGRRKTNTAPPVVLAMAALGAALWLPSLRLAIPLRESLLSSEPGFLQNLGFETLLALILAAPSAVPTTWAFLVLAAHPSAGGAAAGAGRATAWNGIGCLLAPFLSTLLILPAGGTFWLGALSVAALTAAALLLLVQTRGATARTVLPLVVAIALLFTVKDGLFRWITTPGWKIIWAREGASAAVSIEESPEGLRRLRTNNYFTEGGDAAGISQLRQGMFPTLLHTNAQRVLALGVGSGSTLAGTMAGLSDSARVEAAELIPEIHATLGYFARSNMNLVADPRLTIHVADARTFAAHKASAGESFDLVTGELFHTTQAGTGALYAREHFLNVRKLLAARGLFCQWIPLHETPPDEVKTLVRTFYDVFPHGLAFYGTWSIRTPILALIGSQFPVSMSWGAMQSHMQARPDRAAHAQTAELSRLPETLSGFIADAETLRRWAGPGPQNTDQRPTLELDAPLGPGAVHGPQNTAALLPIWSTPALSDPTPERTAELARYRIAMTSFFQAQFAWMKGDLDQAEAALKQAHQQRTGFLFLRGTTKDLAANFRALGNTSRAQAIEAWLSQ